jgi:DNA sulfur modification protein DndC
MFIQDVDRAIADALTRLQASFARETWVIPQSGGKDSRATGQLPAILIEQGRLEPPRRVVLYMADPLLEFEAFMIQAEAGLYELAAKYRSLGVETSAFTTKPLPQDDFWVRIIGYGYAPPTERGRSCTDTLKIAPARKVLRNEGWDKAPLLLGVRRGESERRDEKILTCARTGECGPDYLYLKLTQRASSRPRAMAPILNWRAGAVWDFLTLVAPGYGFDNRALCAVYGPDGDLRYGCWTCPLICQDQTGEYLAGRDPKVGELVRFANSIFRKNGAAGQVENREILIRGGVATAGLLSLDFCRRVFDWLIDFERRWDHPLLTAWQKQVIPAIWQWRASLPAMQAGHGGHLALDFGQDRAALPEYFFDSKPLTRRSPLSLLEGGYD